MTPSAPCQHESEVLDLAALGHWPRRADPALRTHVAGCPVCADLARVATLLADWQDVSLPHVHVPDASRVWREAAQRARADATRRATQPVRVVELVALAAATLLLVAWGPALAGLTIMSLGTGWLTTVWASLASTPSTIATGWASLRLPATLLSTLQWGLLTLAAWAVVVPVAFSLAGLADRTSRPENGHSKPAR